MAGKKKPALYTALTSFFVGRRLVEEGEQVEAKDKILKGREHLFAPVEQATAAPGEKRSVKKPQVDDE